jgi:DNA-binding CsgD family transcriptional regulator
LGANPKRTYLPKWNQLQVRDIRSSDILPRRRTYKVATHPADGRTDRLTSRQASCIALVAKGCSSKEIARELGISPSTVDNHIATAMQIVGLANRVALANWYSENRESEASIAYAQQRHRNQHASNIRISLPPMGGIRNSLSLMERVFSALQIITVSIMAASSLILVVLVLIFFSNWSK